MDQVYEAVITQNYTRNLRFILNNFKEVGSILMEEKHYLGSYRAIRRLGGVLQMAILFETILIGIYIAMIVIKVSLTEDDALYRVIMFKLYHGDRISHRLRSTHWDNWRQRIPWKEFVGFFIIYVLVSVLNFQIRFLRHTYTILTIPNLQDSESVHYLGDIQT